MDEEKEEDENLTENAISPIKQLNLSLSSDQNN